MRSSPDDIQELAMLLPPQVKPLLSHADFYVRSAALTYFSDSFTQDPEILVQILSALPSERERRLSLVVDTRNLAIDDAGLTALLNYFPKEEDPLIRRHIERRIFEAPFPLLVARQVDIEPLAEKEF